VIFIDIFLSYYLNGDRNTLNSSSYWLLWERCWSYSFNDYIQVQQFWV